MNILNSKEVKEHMIILDKERIRIKNIIKDSKEWEQIREDNGVITFQRKEVKSNYKMFRSSIRLKCSEFVNEKIYYEYFTKPLVEHDFVQLKKTRSKHLKEMKIIERYNKNSILVRQVANSGSRFVNNREFIFLSDTKIEKEGIYEISKSINVDNYPETKHVTRGELVYVLFIEREGNYLKIDFVIHVNPKGSIPSTLYNICSTDSASNFLKISKEYFRCLSKKRRHHSI